MNPMEALECRQSFLFKDIYTASSATALAATQPRPSAHFKGGRGVSRGVAATHAPRRPAADAPQAGRAGRGCCGKEQREHERVPEEPDQASRVLAVPAAAEQVPEQRAGPRTVLAVQHVWEHP